MILNRIAGCIFIVIGIVGYMTVADELRHMGEFVGVSSIFLSGIILLIGSVEHRLIQYFPSRWIVSGMLLGIIIGASLDDMFIGVAVGIVTGTLIGVAMTRKLQSGNSNSM
jgi:small basic protein